MSHSKLAWIVVVLIVGASSIAAQDWPQWRE